MAMTLLDYVYLMSRYLFSRAEKIWIALSNKLQVSFCHQEFHQRFWVTYLKQQTQKVTRTYDALIEAETTHQLGATPDKASPSDASILTPVWKRYIANAGNRVINKSANCYISITQCDRTTTNLLQTSEIASPKLSLNWKIGSEYIDSQLQRIALTLAVNLNLFTPL